MMNKKVAFASAVLVVLVAVIVDVAVASKRNHWSTGAAELAVSKKLQVKAFCQPTDHRETCEAELSKAAAHAGRSPADLTEAIFQVTSGKISEAISESKALIDDLQKINMRTSRALHNCRELLGYAVDDIEASLENLQGEVYNVVDLKTWISAALTFQETCLEGVTAHSQAAYRMRAALRSSLELTEDILAILDHLPVAVQEDKQAAPTLVVELKPNMTVASDGSGDFKTINEALARVPRKSTQVYVMYVKAGVYKEYVSVPRDVTNLAMIGDGASKTVITGSRNFKMTLTTKDTATMGEFDSI
jgi:pectinesterase